MLLWRSGEDLSCSINYQLSQTELIMLGLVAVVTRVDLWVLILA